MFSDDGFAAHGFFMAHGLHGFLVTHGFFMAQGFLAHGFFSAAMARPLVKSTTPPANISTASNTVKTTLVLRWYIL